MIKSVMSKYKDIVHILPVNNIIGEMLHNFVKRIIISLEENGFVVISVVTDNNY